MLVISSDQAEYFQNSSACDGFVYPGTGDHINGAVIAVRGRYPELGFLTNEVCREVAYITEGAGKLLSAKGVVSEFKQGDVVFVDRGDVFAWEGQFKGFFATTPTFDPAQHKEVRV